jgi:hypothetical protein
MHEGHHHALQQGAEEYKAATQRSLNITAQMPALRWRDQVAESFL